MSIIDAHRSISMTTARSTMIYKLDVLYRTESTSKVPDRTNVRIEHYYVNFEHYYVTLSHIYVNN